MGAEGEEGVIDAGGKRKEVLDQRLIAFEKEKDAASEAWKIGDTADAIKHWAYARGSLKFIVERRLLADDPDRLAQVKQDEHKMHLNLAQGYLKTGEHRLALDYAKRALVFDNKSEKALYRTCLAYKGMSRYTESRQWIGKLLEAHPENAAARQMLHEVARLEMASHNKEKRSAAKMFKGMSQDHDPRSTRSWGEWVQRLPDNISMDIDSRLYRVECQLKKWWENNGCKSGCCKRRKDEKSQA